MYVNWKGFQTVDSIKLGCEKMLELLKAKKCKKILNDNRMVTGPWQGAAEWVATDWFPRMYAAGLMQLAWIVSPNIFSQMSMEATVSKNKDEKTRTFENYTKAEDWLLSGK
jgi:hypothetical protein